MTKLKLDFLSTLVLLNMLIISSESDQYKGVQNEKSKLPLKYMTDYFCRSVYILKCKILVFIQILTFLIIAIVTINGRLTRIN